MVFESIEKGQWVDHKVIKAIVPSTLMRHTKMETENPDYYQEHLSAYFYILLLRYEAKSVKDQILAAAEYEGSPSLGATGLEQFNAGIFSYQQRQYSDAFYWFEKAAEIFKEQMRLGNVAAINSLGNIYYREAIAGCKREEAKAMYLMAAELGNAAAQNNLSSFYHTYFPSIARDELFERIQFPRVSESYLFRWYKVP